MCSANARRYVQSGLIKVLVGEERKEFNVYKGLLAAKSGFFAARLKDDWNDGTNEISLDSEIPYVFASLLDWMFTGKFNMAVEDVEDNITEISLLYKLADFLLIAPAKNDLIDLMLLDLKTTDTYYTFGGLRYIWEADGRETKLFTLALRSCVKEFMRAKKQKTESSLTEALNDVPDVMLAALRSIAEYNCEPWKQVYDQDRCQYHDHSDGSSCKT